MSTEGRTSGIKILQNKSDKKQSYTVNQLTVAPYIGVPDGAFFSEKESSNSQSSEKVDNMGKILEDKTHFKSVAAGPGGISIAFKLKNGTSKNQVLNEPPYSELRTNGYSASHLVNRNRESPRRGNNDRAGHQTDNQPGRKVFVRKDAGDPRPKGKDDGLELQKLPMTMKEKLECERAYFEPIKLIDSSLKWSDFDTKLSIESTNHMVVGVIGKQGVGKSTVLDILCSGTDKSSSNPAVPKNRAREWMRCDTTGVRLTVNNDRILFLDCQPVLSGSVLDWLNRADRLPPPEVKYGDNWVELQSLQLAAFMLSVCHVVLVVSEWELDMELVSFVKMANILKPSPPVPSDRNGNTLQPVNHVPSVVFVVNKAQEARNARKMHGELSHLLDEMLRDSKLAYKNGVSQELMLRELNFACGGKGADGLECTVNLCCLPTREVARERAPPGGERSGCVRKGFRGRPGFEESLRWLKSRVVSIPTSPITVLNTEKHWLTHCQKMWEITRKCQLITEYCQFLT